MRSPAAIGLGHFPGREKAMIAQPRSILNALTLAAVFAASASGQSPTYVDEGGIRYQVTKQTFARQIPVPETREQQQTIYRQQVTTETVQHQQMYTVPVTQYQVVSRLNGRWNPFVTPYWTHHYEPVTVWQQQIATVQIPVNRVAWAPETRTVQAPMTTYRTVEDVVERRVAIGPTPTNTAVASTARPLSSAPVRTATLAPSSGNSTSTAASSGMQRPIGGEAMPSDPPRTATGWQSQSESRY